MREDYNRSAPSVDNDRFASHIAAVIGGTTRLAGSSADPAAYAQRAVGKLGVMTLPYQFGTRLLLTTRVSTGGTWTMTLWT